MERVFTAQSRIQIWFSHQYLIVMKLIERSKTSVCSKHNHKACLISINYDAFFVERVFTTQSNEEAIFVTSNVERVFTAQSRIQIWFSHQYLIVMKLIERSKTSVCSKHTHKTCLISKLKNYTWNLPQFWTPKVTQ